MLMTEPKPVPMWWLRENWVLLLELQASGIGKGTEVIFPEGTSKG